MASDGRDGPLGKEAQEHADFFSEGYAAQEELAGRKKPVKPSGGRKWPSWWRNPLFWLALIVLMVWVVFGTNAAQWPWDTSEPAAPTEEPSTTVSTTSPVGPGESTATLDASVCDTFDEVAVEAWRFTEGEVFYGVGEGRNWFLCLYGDGVAGRIRPLWDKAIDNTYVITGDTYRFESNWPTLFEPLGTEYLSTRVFEMTRTGDVLEGEVVWIGWELASVYDAEGSATPEWVAIEHAPETETVRAVLLPRSS